MKAAPQKPTSTATVSATLVVGSNEFWPVEREMSTDLPAHALGELVAEVMQKAWAQGFDPVKDSVEVRLTFR